MSFLEQQAEEREVLLSIYEGDPCFNNISPTTFQYKYGDNDHPKSFLLEISWPSDYPSTKPTINMDTFYNKHLVNNVKNSIVLELEKECEPLLGEAMTYTLFEYAKEHESELTSDQPENLETVESVEKDLSAVSIDQESSKKEKKEQLSKSQKRRQWERSDHKGEKPRGWNWVDLVKHLSQTGSKPSEDMSTA